MQFLLPEQLCPAPIPPVQPLDVFAVGDRRFLINYLIVPQCCVQRLMVVGNYICTPSFQAHIVEGTADHKNVITGVSRKKTGGRGTSKFKATHRIVLNETSPCLP